MSRYLLAACLVLVGCADDIKTETFPLTACATVPSGATRHQHRNGYTGQVRRVDSANRLAVFVPHTYTHPVTGRRTTTIRYIPIYHPAQDWDEVEFVTTCAKSEWRRK